MLGNPLAICMFCFFFQKSQTFLLPTACPPARPPHFLRENWRGPNNHSIVALLRTRVKIKDLNIKLFYKFLLIIKSWYICCGLHLKSFIKLLSQFHNVTTQQKSCYLIGRLRKSPWFSSFDFSEARQIS